MVHKTDDCAMLAQLSSERGGRSRRVVMVANSWLTLPNDRGNPFELTEARQNHIAVYGELPVDDIFSKGSDIAFQNI
ncbi:hypothetical protein TNCV_4324911 [Trichonephila clavipes]|nr:hypothetical protein TNCV_4324911 [Trichonephila clavipes]